MRTALCTFALVGIILVSGAILLKGNFDLAGIMPNPDYNAILAQQPAGLGLAMTLPKDHFYQGEMIAATLTYSNTGKDSYSAWIAAGDRSGRIQDIRFFGQDEKGAAVEDPLGWIYMRGIFGGGRGEYKELKDGSTATITLTINQWLRFDHPGTYTVFAEATNVRSDAPHAPNTDNSAHLISNKATITITPLPPEQEKKIIDDAMLQIVAAYDRHDDPNLTDAANEENAHTKAYAAEPAIATLRFLQTPAARAALRSRLDKTPEYMRAGEHFEIEAALLGAPDRPAEAAHILEDVQAGRLKIDNSLIGLYAQLKSYPQFMEQITWERRTLTPADTPQKQAIDAAWEKAEKDAEKEILAAATQASSKTGVSNLDLIWSAFLMNPSDPEYRAPAVAHQLDFSPEKQHRLLSIIAAEAGAEFSFASHAAVKGRNPAIDFLPLVKLYLGAPEYNGDALIILGYLRPDEAKPLVVADLASPSPHYLDPRVAVTFLENHDYTWSEAQKNQLYRMVHPR